MYEDLVNLIGSVGFPIAAFIMIWYQNNTTIKEMREAIDNNNTLLEQLTVLINKEVK